jgi:4-oxalocrotonate tautomerase
MPIVNIITWQTPKEVKQKMILEITRIIHETTGAPLDKITVYLQEVNKADWAEAGTFGDDPDFGKKSRRLNFDE